MAPSTTDKKKPVVAKKAAPKKDVKKAAAPKGGKKASPVAAKKPAAPAKKRITIAPEGVVLSAKEASKKKQQTVAVAARKGGKKPLAGTMRNAEKKAVKKNVKGGGKRKIGTRKSGGKDKDGNVTRYPVLQLRHVHPQFEEPQLIKFFSQFGTKVVNAYCVRSKNNHQSKGVAYVQFEDSKVLPTVIDEVHGMLLGGFTVRARRVYMTRAMPTKPSIISRRRKAEIIAARGVRLNRFDLSKKQKHAASENPKRVVGFLKKYAEAEKKSNERNKMLGIDFAFNGYQNQLASVKKEFFLTGAEKEAAKAAKAKAASSKKGAAKPDAKKAASSAEAAEESDSSSGDDLSVESE